MTVDRPVLNLHMTQRSCDVPVGVPYNIAGYAFILELVAHLTGIQAGKFAHTLVDAHIYTNQFDGVAEQLKREPGSLPKLVISPGLRTLDGLDELIRDGTTEQIMDCFKIIDYHPQPFIKFPIAV
jgi:thymidylate synthase